MAGSAVQYLAQQPTTVAIIKDHNMTVIQDSYRWGVLFDGSAIAEQALRKTLSMMADVDRLSTITVVEQGMDADTCRQKIAAIVGDRQCDVVVI